MKKIIIFGNGQVAELAYFYFTKDSNFEVSAFTADEQYITSSLFQGLPCVPFQTVEKHFSPHEYGFFVALSYTHLNALRTQKYLEAKKKGYEIVSYLSSKAVIWPNLEMKENCFILENNTIQPFVSIGNNVTIWSGTHVGHHSIIDDHCFLASHIVISGNVHIGNSCFIGVNATLRDNIEIGEKSIVGAGTLLLTSVESEGLYIGKSTERASIPSSKLKNF